MKNITAQLNSYRQSPRKVRLVADTIRGKSAKDAKIKLDFLTKRASSPLHKLLNSAIANAKDVGADVENLWVKAITVDQGKTLYRRKPVSRGAAHPIRKRTSHINIVLSDKLKNSKIKKLKNNT